jgi:hypothetical protein
MVAIASAVECAALDHAAISLRSEGQEALFGGDVLHHPLEIYQPDLVSMFL